MRAMQITDLGQPLRLAEVPVPDPGPGEVLLRVAACGINFADTLMVAGRYQEKPALPFAPGLEVAGTVAAAGPGTTLAPGTRVAAMTTAGGLADYVVVAAARFAAPRATATTRAPISAPTSTAVRPTPPAAPVTSSVSPGRSRARKASAAWLVP